MRKKCSQRTSTFAAAKVTGVEDLVSLNIPLKGKQCTFQTGDCGLHLNVSLKKKMDIENNPV